MIEEIRDKYWDIIIIGTGIGGSTLGYALAKAGKKVLFLEKGKSYFSEGNSALKADYAEHFSDNKNDPNLLGRAGRYSKNISFGKYESIPFMGCGTGGSSALYGMQMERFKPVDFKTWPITFEEIENYYEQAEKLYGVKAGEGNKLPPAPALTPANKELFDFLNGKGLHPYPSPMACDYAEGCKECIGFICPKNCKNDSVKICLLPALQEYSAKLLSDCEAYGIATNDKEAIGVKCRKDGQEFIVSGKIIVLAAGAIETPAMLLRSMLANDSGMVGKNLMRHFIDLYSIKTKNKVQPGEFTKQISFNDFYIVDGVKMGNVQALGNIPKPEVIAAELAVKIKRKIPFLGSFFTALAFPFIKKFIQHNLKNKIILAGIMEDLPYPENCISLNDNGNPVIKYTLHKEAKTRLALFRKKIKQALSPYTFTFVAGAHDNEHLAHICGTCKAGDDPKTSVVDKHNKAHGLDNLYIVDSSFFPSSSGTNPSLTIAANALRVAEHILNHRSI